MNEIQKAQLVVYSVLCGERKPNKLLPIQEIERLFLSLGATTYRVVVGSQCKDEYAYSSALAHSQDGGEFVTYASEWGAL